MTQSSVITQEMRDAIGVESEPYVNEIEKGAIIRFAEAIGDDNPIFRDEVLARRSRYGGIIASPTFLRSLKSGPARVQVESPHTQRLDGGSEWEYFEPVRPRDRITVTTSLKEVTERVGRLGIMLLMIRETKYVNQLGQLAAIQRSTGIGY